MNNRQSLYLCHHGIKGQKWGVKHGPPYPIDETISREIRINRMNKGPYVKYTSKNSELIANQPGPERLDELQIKTDSFSAAEDAKLVNNRAARGKVGRIFNCQNCACAYDMRRRGYDVSARLRDDGSNVFSVEKNFEGGKFSSADTSDLAKDMAKSDSESEKQFMDRRNEMSLEAYSRFESELTAQPPGARGIVVVGWVSNFYKPGVRTSDFHAFNYEITKSGKVEYFDTEGELDFNFGSEHFTSKQSYDTYDLGLEMKGNVELSLTNFVDPREWAYMRTDDLKPSESITSAVISRKLVDKE